MPDLLASRRGRLLTFFLLYVTEGIPLGFTATAVATHMRRNGVGPEQIGWFVGSLYLPWAFKWAAGPVVDTIYSERLGRRRAWIVAAQLGMMLTLLAAMPVNFSIRLTLFTWIILAHNAFGALQDVAIDALAVSVLREDERGLGNGLMFAGANVGQAVGGAGVLLMTRYVPSFNWTFPMVVAAIAAIMALVTLRIRETPAADASGGGGGVASRSAGGGPSAGTLLREHVITAARAMLGSRAALAAVLLALLPMGASALSLSLSSSLSVELGLTDDGIAGLSLVSTLTGAAGCVVGGYLSDRFGRRRTIAIYVIGMSVPTLLMAAAMRRHGWVMPVDTLADARRVAPAALLAAFWAAATAHALFNGLMYGARTALYMDVTRPAVAATQFTAYMAMLNLVIAYSAAWQGSAVKRVGYPATLALDAGVGLLCLAVLPFVKRPPGASVQEAPVEGESRARVDAAAAS